jgi:hypothetical protein
MANTQTSLEGGARPTNLSKEEVLANALNDYRANLPTPDNDGVAIAPQKEVTDASVNQNPEEKFYESLGLEDKGGLTLPLKSKGRLLVAVVLVVGYFAYKKFNK